MMKKEKKLLYIERNPYSWKNIDTKVECQTCMMRVFGLLLDSYDAALVNDLDNISTNYISSLSLDVLVTHLPEDKEKDKFEYSKSIDKIRRIHESSKDLKIIIYTGASKKLASDEMLKQAGAYGIVRKRRLPYIEEDIEEILDLIVERKDNRWKE